MNRLLNKYKWLRIIIGFVMVVLGIITLVLTLSGQGSDITKTLCIMLAIYCFLIGVFSIVVSLVVETKYAFPMDLITGSVFIGLGIALCFVNVAAGIIDTILQYCIPWILIALGGVSLLKAIVLLANKGSVAAWVIALVAGAVSLTLGIVFWCCKTNMGDAIYTIVAIVLIIAGALETISGIIDTTKNKKHKKHNVVAEIGSR